jgi:hypothetical protein
MEVKNNLATLSLSANIKSMMELGEFMMLSIEMKNNRVTLSLSASD